MSLQKNDKAWPFCREPEFTHHKQPKRRRKEAKNN